MTPLPLISIVTVVFNDFENIEETILSVLNQTYGPKEYIIIDGGSTDGTVDIIKKYADSLRGWVSEPDKGIYDAMNKGLERTSGEWISFMNSGDRFASHDVLELFRTAFAGEDILYGDAIIEYPTFAKQYPRYPVESMWKQMPFCHQAAFVRSAVMRAAKFNLKYRLGADFDFFYRAYRSKKRFLYIDRLICRFNFTQGASTSYAIRSIQDRRDSVLSEGFHFGKWLYYFFLIQYARISIVIKAIIGRKLTAWLTRYLRT